MDSLHSCTYAAHSASRFIASLSTPGFSRNRPVEWICVTALSSFVGGRGFISLSNLNIIGMPSNMPKYAKKNSVSTRVEGTSLDTLAVL